MLGFRHILVPLGFSFFLLPLTAHCQELSLAKVPAEIPLAQRLQFKQDSTKLDLRIDDINQEIASFLEQCGTVRSDQTELIQRCTAWQGQLNARKENLFADVSAYEQEINEVLLKLKEPLFSKGSQGSAPPYLGNLNSKWPIVVDLKKVQGGTPEALKSANLKTHALLDALENFPNDWEGSIRYLENRLADSPGDLAVRDALNLVRGYYMGYLGAKNVGDKYYRSGVRAWLRGNFDYAARSFATAFRENPNDTLLFRSFAYTFGLRDGSGDCEMPTSCSHIIDIPENHTIEVEDLYKEIKQKLDEARSDLTLLPNNLQLRATLNYLEAHAAYNDYLDSESGKSLSIDKKDLELISKGLDRLGEKDYIGGWEDFAKAFEENTDNRDIYFIIHYSKGLAAMQRLVPAYLPGDGPGDLTDLRKYQSIPEALWDQRTIEEYDAYLLEMLEAEEREDEEMLELLFGDMPVGSSTIKFNQQIKNTETENPFFGDLSEEVKQRFIEADKFIRR